MPRRYPPFGSDLRLARRPYALVVLLRHEASLRPGPGPDRPRSALLVLLLHLLELLQLLVVELVVVLQVLIVVVQLLVLVLFVVEGEPVVLEVLVIIELATHVEVEGLQRRLP